MGAYFWFEFIDKCQCQNIIIIQSISEMNEVTSIRILTEMIQ